MDELKNKKVISYISAEEFRGKGYLQELNRRYLHPLGLAMAVEVLEDGTEQLGGIVDFRENKDGVHYNLENASDERIDKFISRKKFIDSEIEKRYNNRVDKFGSVIEPIIK